MTRWVLLASALSISFVAACGSSQQEPKSQEGAGERAGKKLDEAAGDIKRTGDDVGSEVGKSFGDASKDIKGKLGVDDETKDAGAASSPRDGG